VHFHGGSNEVLRPAYVWNRYKSQEGAADFQEGLFQAREVLLIFARASFKRCFSRGPFELLKDLSNVSSCVYVCVCVCTVKIWYYSVSQLFVQMAIFGVSQLFVFFILRILRVPT
jgi:hypothetical protein